NVHIYVGHGKAYTKWRKANSKKNRYLRSLLKCFHDPINSKSFDRVEISDLNQIIGTTRYDIIYAFRISMGRAAQAIIESNPEFSNTLSVVDFDDIESKAKLREAHVVLESEGRLNSLMLKLEARKIKTLESQQLKYFSQVHVCSEADKAELDARKLTAGQSNVRVLPNTLDLPTKQTAKPEPSLLPNLLFVGTMDHGPNVDAIHYIVKELYPHLVKILNGNFEINIVGRYPTEQIMAYASIPQVNIHADVPNVEPYYSAATIVIAPIRFGGGTRLKILEAFAYGKPVVSTSIGAEGIDVKNGHGIIIADSAEDFSKKCAELITNQPLAQSIATNAYSLYLELYSYKACKKRLTSYMAELGF
ncbi:MAG: glycosyltransferase, partial [Pseudomonadales bacterium]|nr:glycosyltransferase [Pseudomonadales bacterium]